MMLRAPPVARVPPCPLSITVLSRTSHTHHIPSAHKDLATPTKLLRRRLKTAKDCDQSPTVCSHQASVLVSSIVRADELSTAPAMSHESVWYSRPRTYGKGSRSWYVCPPPPTTF